MHTWNKLLPAVVRDGIKDDEMDSLNQLNCSMSELRVVLRTEGCLLGNKDIGTLLRLIHTHNTLKYTMEVRFNSYCKNKLPIFINIHILGTHVG